MLKTIQILGIIIIPFLFPFFVFASGSPSPSEVCWQNCVDAGTARLQCIECIFIRIFNIIIPIAGLAAFVAIILGGFQYLTSGGDPKKLEQAKGVVFGAIIGIVVILGIWFIFKLINFLTGLNLLQFEIPK